MKTLCIVCALALLCGGNLVGAEAKPRKAAEIVPEFPPVLEGGKTMVTETSEAFLKPPANLKPEIAIAKTPPTVDFIYYPGQDYPGKPWSVWGDGVAVQNKYYSAIGDHLWPGGNAMVFEYDAESKKLRRLMDLGSLLKLPEGDYVPGKIHSRVDLGDDGWLYFATHRGSPRATTDQYHYRGDWLVRHQPATGKSEVVVHAPVPRHSIPASVLDGRRLILYGATAPPADAPAEDIRFFAYDVGKGKLLYSGANGPSRCFALARSSGRVYFTPGTGEASLTRFDPAAPQSPVQLEPKLNIRAASQETAQGLIYLVSTGQGGKEATLSALNPKTETVESLGPAGVGSQQYITTIDADPTGRYLYYMPGAHGGSENDGTPVVQFDTRSKQKKVIAFLHPFFKDRYGCALKGTYSAALNEAGDTLYVTWNASRGTRAWDCCALTVIHIPAAERKP